jgi:hypothetical protein
MSETDTLYSFAMRGLLTEVALDNTERQRKTKVGDDEFKKVNESLGLDLLDEQLVATAKKMAIIFTAICAFENYVRRFISEKLEEVHKDDWWNKCVSDKIRKFAESRREKESKVRWHAPRGDALINYTEFGDLVSIIRNNWNDFEPHINSIEWADSIIKTLERSRNVIMHSGELVNHDIERVGMNIRDWVNQVG